MDRFSSFLQTSSSTLDRFTDRGRPSTHGRSRQQPLSAYRDRIEELELTVSTREDVISHLNQDVEKLLLELRSLGELKVAGERQGKAQLQGVQQRADQLEQDKQALQQASDGLQALVGQLRQESTEAARQAAAQLDEVEQLARAAQASLQAEIDDLGHNLQQEQEHAANITSQLQSSSAELSAKAQALATLQQQHGEQSARVDALSGDLDDARRQYDEKAAEADALQQSLDSLQHRADEQAASMQDLQSQLERLQQSSAREIAELHEQAQAAADDRTAAEGRWSQEQETMHAEAEAHTSAIADLEEQKASLSSEVSRLEGERDRLVEEAGDLQGQLAAAQSSSEESKRQMRQQLQLKQDEVTHMRSELSQIRGELGQAQEQITAGEEEVKALQQQVHNGQQELQEEVQQLREASAGQATSVASLQHQHQQEREAWERDMRQLRAELERKAAAHPLSAELPGARGGGEEQAGAPEVEHLLAEIERLRQERADAEAQADELASSLAAERRRSEQSGPGPGSTSSLAALGGLASPLLDNGYSENDSDYLTDARWDALREAGTAAGWLVDPTEVSLGPELGQGSFGTTFRGTWRGGQLAVKRVRISKPDEATSFLREVHTLASLRHPNIMPFCGACLMPPKHCYLLCELLPGGTLTTWLHGNRRQGGRAAPRRALAEKLHMALGVARGMQALEEAQPPILHRDLKPSNVFIDAGGNPRVADMGLARRWEPESAASLTGETGTYHYMAPEMIRHEMYDSHADVYSWGVLFAEILQQQPPYEGLYCTPVQIALAVGEDKLRPTIPPDTPRALVSIAGACFEPEPAMRPSFGVIVHHLSKFQAQMPGAASSPEGGGGLRRMFGWGSGVTESASPTKRAAGVEANGHDASR